MLWRTSEIRKLTRGKISYVRTWIRVDTSRDIPTEDTDVYSEDRYLQYFQQIPEDALTTLGEIRILESSILAENADRAMLESLRMMPTDQLQ